MNALKITMLATTLGLAAVTAFAGERNAPETRVVNFAALDAASAAGADELYRRLTVAAREVCASTDGVMLSEKHQYRSCVNTALANAIAQVNQPLVTQAYDTRTRGRKIRIASR